MEPTPSKPSWNEQEAESQQRPRPPKTTDQSKPTESITSKLNVNAKEWVPSKPTNACYNSQHSQGDNRYSYGTSQQGRLQCHKLEALSLNDTTTTGSDFEVLKEIIFKMTSDPGEFEESINDFIDILMSSKDDAEMFVHIATFIFTQAVKEASFRYNGARLCAVIYQKEARIFKTQIDNLCSQEIKKNPQNSGVTLFLAELYTQINAPDYAKLLYESISNLLLANDESVKSVCQTLKLCGRNLENESKEKMDKTLNALSAAKDKVRPNIKALIESVEKLRSSNWGDPANLGNSWNNVPKPSDAEDAAGFSRGWSNLYERPTFYGPDGEEISEEQHKFLDSVCGIKDEEEDYDDPDGLFDPEEEMDEEIQAAFKEFVKMSK